MCKPVYRWYLRAIDEILDDKLELFRKEWTRQTRADGERESIDHLRLRHELIIKRLEGDRQERQQSLQSVNQNASVTLAALSVLGLGIATAVGAIAITAPIPRAVVTALAIIVWLVVGSYMPKFVKSLKAFMDAGEYVVRHGIPYSETAEAEETYTGERLLRSYAESIVHELNVRNPILTRARRKLTFSYKLVQLMIVGGVASLFWHAQFAHFVAYLAARW